MQKTTPLYLGADPGKHGAVVLISEDRSDVIQIPTKVKDGSIDVVMLYDSLLPYVPRIKGACMEQVHALFGSSAGATFEFGDANGSLRTLLVLLSEHETKFKVILVQPKIWQRVAWYGVDKVESPVTDINGRPKLLKSGKPRMKVDTKATSAAAAHKLFPSVTFVPPRCRVEHDGCIDAALIAYYGYIRLSER